jgi:dipeptide transport system ATP-binding protein
VSIILEASNLCRFYQLHRGLFRKDATLKALNGATFTLEKGKTLAVVGESGCGKSTLARLITMIEPPTSGTLSIHGIDVTRASKAEIRKLRSKVQIVFQDPYGSLNPRQKLGMSLEEPLLVNTTLTKGERRKAAMKMMEEVGLRPEYYDRYPHMFSGGQRQRIAVARALMLNPDIVVLDEPVSALDVSIQAQILNLLVDLQERLNLAYLFVSHALSVVKHIADDVMVMYLGTPVEMGSRQTIFSEPRHPYTKSLLSATPVADPMHQKNRTILKGELPSPINPPTGCTFHPRCPEVMGKCSIEAPQRRKVGPSEVACHAVTR